MRRSPHSRFRKVVALLVALAIADPGVPWAQTLPSPGTRVRIRRLPWENRPLIGVLESWRPDTAVVLSDSAGARVLVPVERVVRFEKSAGKGPATGAGAQNGAVLGGVLGVG